MSDDATEGEQRPLPVVVGVDVGGTNTDAVVISKVKGQGVRVLAEDKHLTTSDVTAGKFASGFIKCNVCCAVYPVSAIVIALALVSISLVLSF